MEEKELNISFNKSGRGSITPRVILPISWTKKMKLDENNKQIKASYGLEKILLERGNSWENELEDNKKGIFKKIKMMELGLMNDEKLDLIGEARFHYEGDYLGFRLFLCDSQESSTIISQTDYFYRFLSYKKLEDVSSNIHNIGKEFCKCELESLFDPEHQCKCDTPTIDACSKIFYTRLIEEVENRALELKPAISTRVKK